MKLRVTFNATCYKTKSNIMESKRVGEPAIKWYQILVDQNDDVCTLTCSKEVFENAERGKEYVFEADFDEEMKKFKVVGIVDFPNFSSSKSGKHTDGKPADGKPVNGMPADPLAK